MKIVFTGGGSAGHIFPILAIVREMKKMMVVEATPDNQQAGRGLELFYLGPKDGYSLQLLSREDVRIKKICTGKFRRYFSLKNVLDLFKMPVSLWQALFWLFVLSPDLVFSTGGHGSFPTALAARILHIPIFLNEADIAPGLASRMESKWALEVFTSFEDTEYFPKEKIVCVGNPIRSKIIGGSKTEAKKLFNLKGDKPLVLFLGGSQGAQSINSLILEILPEITTAFEIIHQTGHKNFQEVKTVSEALIKENLKKYYHPLPFLNEEEMKNALAAANLVVSRAGSGALFEIASAQKPAILIPLPASAQNHQLKNGYKFAEEGAGQVMEEQNLKPHFFFEKLKDFFSRPKVLAFMAKSAGEFSRPKAAKVIATYLLEYLVQTGEAIKEER